MIIHGNSLDVLKTIEGNSVDCCVTDPPYELGFMGKKWDASGIAYNVALWCEVLRVLKPGGHLLSFGGSRTYHRMACAIEDAGFEVRDMIEWVYGSGFPKSLNIGKAIDTLQGNERKVFETNETIPDIRSNNYSNSEGKERLKANITKGTSEWEGWGTALKPAHEPICMARKPISDTTVAENVLKWGTGGINVDECRVEADGNDINARKEKGGKHSIWDNAHKNYGEWTGNQGRFPANFIHDGSDEVVRLFPMTTSGDLNGTHRSKKICYGEPTKEPLFYQGDSGSAARFFYCAKASREERNAGLENIIKEREGNRPNSKDKTGKFPDHDHRIRNGNHHPTVKPIALMKYLITLVCPPNGILLDPFTGSGTTLLAAQLLGFKFIGIEKEAEYIEITKKRLQAPFMPSLFPLTVFTSLVPASRLRGSPIEP